MISPQAIEAGAAPAVSDEMVRAALDAFQDTSGSPLELAPFDAMRAALEAALAADGMALVPVEALSYARQMSNFCFNGKQLISRFDEKTRRFMDQMQTGFDRALSVTPPATPDGKNE